MNSEQAKLVERLHSVLVEEIRTRRPEYLREPFTVAEIYQELVPYRNYRDQIGAAMNGDYEDALLRLLSGSGGYLVLESEQARKRMLDELQSSNPNTGIFREYAALDVRLNQARIPSDSAHVVSAPAAVHAAASAPSSAPLRPPPATAPTAAAVAPSPSFGGSSGPAAPRMEQQMQTPSPQSAQPAPASPKPPERAPAAAKAQATGDSTPCRWCREELPRREKMRFCPFCGMDVNLVPCRACGEELEPEWRFCVACGTEVSAEG